MFRSDPYCNVVNLSNHSFSKSVFQVLNKNLNFCPTPGYYKNNELKTNFNDFFRRIKLKAHFASTEYTNEEEGQFQQNKTYPFLREKSSWEPKSVHHNIKTYIDAVEKDLEEHNTTKHLPKCNITKKEKKAIIELSNRNDLIITKADKGGATVILDVQDYIREAQRQLDDENFYKKLNTNLTEIYNMKINQIIDNFVRQKAIDEKMGKMLKTQQPKTSHLYLLPKIHKEGVPGRPIVSSINCHTSKLSKYVDFFLKPSVKKLKSFVKDSSDFLLKLNSVSKQDHKDTIFVTLDVKSLYTNIPNHEGIEAVKSFISRENRNMQRVIITFLHIILNHNNFTFNDTNYLQTKGCPMGTICAPSYANLFMGVFEEIHIYPFIKDKISLYLRYIDDIIIFWKDTEENLNRFIQNINECHQSIKFDFRITKNESIFLDIKIFKDRNGNLQTTLYQKPTDRKSYLHFTSEHPKHLIKSIPYSQALRIKKICSDEDDLKQQLKNLHSSFLKRGYKEEKLKEDIEKVTHLDRMTLLSPKEKNIKNVIPFITTYNRTLPNIKDILSKHWELLQINEKFRKIFEQKPMICYRRNKNLRNLIGGNILSKNEVVRKGIPTKLIQGKCSPCNSRRNNLCCKQVLPATTFRSAKTNKEFKIFHKLNCKSVNVIYLLECKLHHIQYIGKSETPFNIRLNNHRKDVKNPNSIPACKHFNEQGHIYERDAKFILIEQLKKDLNKELQSATLKRRENFWINKLKTLHPNGLNQELNQF